MMEWAKSKCLAFHHDLVFENCPAAKVLEGTMRLMQCLAEAKEVSERERQCATHSPKSAGFDLFCFFA